MPPSPAPTAAEPSLPAPSAPWVATSILLAAGSSATLPTFIASITGATTPAPLLASPAAPLASLPIAPPETDGMEGSGGSAALSDVLARSAMPGLAGPALAGAAAGVAALAAPGTTFCAASASRAAARSAMRALATRSMSRLTGEVMSMVSMLSSWWC